MVVLSLFQAFSWFGTGLLLVGGTETCPSSWKTYDKSWVLRWLQAQENFKHPLLWQTRLSFYLATVWLEQDPVSSTGSYRLLGGTGYRCQNRDHWESSHQPIFPWASAVSVLLPSEIQLTFTSSGDTSRPLSVYRQVSYETTVLHWVPGHVILCVHPPRVESLFSRALWSS